ncbi:hypothetical protein MMC07_002891 [Pseudocyphellaria aurata]|nr:hypothetical protein [Pseudocyphellaria aurata]
MIDESFEHRLQVSASALHSGGAVVWVDASSALAGPRLREIVIGFHTQDHLGLPKSTSSGKSLDSLLTSFHHFYTPTLPHLLALLTHESTLFPPKETGLIVVDSASSLFTAAFPRASDNLDSKQNPERQKKNDEAHWAASRKWAVMSDFVSKLGKLAATKNIAILITSQTTTRIKAETGAMIHSAVAGTAWDAGISARIFLFRDWLFNSREEPQRGSFVAGVRFAGIKKAGGVSYDRLGQIVSYIIGKDGLLEINMDYPSPNPTHSPVLPVQSHKRKRDEIRDSESADGEIGSDEEFGWGSEDNPLAAQTFVG